MQGAATLGLILTMLGTAAVGTTAAPSFADEYEVDVSKPTAPFRPETSTRVPYEVRYCYEAGSTGDRHAKIDVGAAQSWLQVRPEPATFVLPDPTPSRCGAEDAVIVVTPTRDAPAFQSVNVTLVLGISGSQPSSPSTWSARTIPFSFPGVVGYVAGLTLSHKAPFGRNVAVEPGAAAAYAVGLANTGNGRTEVTFTVSSTPPDVPIRVVLPPLALLRAGETQNLPIGVEAADDAEEGRTAEVTLSVTGRSSDDPAAEESRATLEFDVEIASGVPAPSGGLAVLLFLGAALSVARRGSREP